MHEAKAPTDSEAIRPCVLLAGGGTGGHIYPNLAIAESVATIGPAVACQFLLSQRPIDTAIARQHALAYQTLTAQPLPKRPGAVWPFIKTYWAARREVRRLIAQTRPAALIATGGFVSAPAAHAARSANVPIALVNLDATPGLANRLVARWATTVFTVYPTAHLPDARTIGMPIRAAALADDTPSEARGALGLDPDRPTLLVTAGSQGARTINNMIAPLINDPPVKEALAGWQILHLAGSDMVDEVETTYQSAGLSAKVLSYCHAMGNAWAAADLAISRAGAATVGEIWANHVPALFMPYPYHRDQHQQHNARPLVEAGGAELVSDRIDPDRNARTVRETLVPLLGDRNRLTAMRDSLANSQPPAGAHTVADWTLAMFHQ